LNQLSSRNSNKLTIRAELEGIDCILEVNAVEDDAAGDVDKVAAVVLVDCEKESAIGGGGDAADVG
jgi:hypothetical protein